MYIINTLIQTFIFVQTLGKTYIVTAAANILRNGYIAQGSLRKHATFTLLLLYKYSASIFKREQACSRAS